MSLRFWQQVSKPSRQVAPHLALPILGTVISVWIHLPLHHLREVEEEHLTAPDLGLLSHKTRATAVPGQSLLVSSQRVSHQSFTFALPLSLS